MVNLISLEKAAKAYAHRSLLDGVSLGVSAGDRIGVVGRNGAGKSTLLRMLAGRVAPDTGRVATASGLRLGYLPQADQLAGSVGEIVFGPMGGTVGRFAVGPAVAGSALELNGPDIPRAPWEADPRARAIMAELLPGIGVDAQAGQLSGGERRRVALAALLVAEQDVLLLDEPTNHLDIEAIDWLGRAKIALAMLMSVRSPDFAVVEQALESIDSAGTQSLTSVDDVPMWKLMRELLRQVPEMQVIDLEHMLFAVGVRTNKSIS